MYGAALEIDLLQSRDSNIPSLDDWFSTSEAASLTTLGIMCHRLLAQVMEKALPTWSSMLPPNDQPQGRSTDGATCFRIRIQRKAWRSKLFLSNQKEQEECVLLTYLGLGVEQLMQRLDKLDQSGKGLWDLPFAELSPFVACNSYLCRAVVTGARPGSVLCSFFDQFSDGSVEENSRLMGKVRSMGQEMGAQVWWRYLPLHELPISLGQLVNPGIPEAKRGDMCKDILTAPPCCWDKGCSEKVVKVFGPWEAACKSVPLKDGLIGFVHSFRFTNMSMERLLGLIRQALDGNMSVTEVEATCGE